VNEAERQHGSASEFLQIKREVLGALSSLDGGFGSAALDREAEQAANRIRYLLAQIPTLEHVELWLERDSHGLARAWHGVFLHLSVLSGVSTRRLPLSAFVSGASRVALGPARAGGSVETRRAFAFGGLIRGAIALVVVVATFVFAERLFRSLSRDVESDDAIAAPSPQLR
jgi:hypothetical protein